MRGPASEGKEATRGERKLQASAVLPLLASVSATSVDWIDFKGVIIEYISQVFRETSASKVVHGLLVPDIGTIAVLLHQWSVLIICINLQE